MACAIDSEFRSFLEYFHQSIVENLNVTSLLPILVSKGIINNSEKDQLLTSARTNKARAELIFTVLLQRGPTLFNRFISALQEDEEYQHKELVLKLVQGQSMYTSMTPRPPSRAKRRLNTQNTTTEKYAYCTLEDYEDNYPGLCLIGIMDLGQELGNGCYGRVYTIEYRGSLCAAKEIHHLLLQNIESEKLQKLKNDFLKECYHCSNIIHPNIVQCLGVYYPTEHSFPVRVSELMDTSLPIYMERSSVSYPTRISTLNDVAKGLNFLHTRNPPMSHCDLFPNNVLLKYTTRNNMLPVAKIADLGVAKVMQAVGKSRNTLSSEMPESVFLYMPPDPASSSISSRMQIDVFSFGGISLYVFSDVLSLPVDPIEFDLKTHQSTLITEDVELQSFSSVLKENYSLNALTQLKAVIVSCMCYHAESRPPITTVSETIRDLMINHTDDKIRNQALKTKLATLVSNAETSMDSVVTHSQEVQEEMSDSLKVTDSDVDKPPAKEEMINSLKVTDSDVDKPLAKEEMINSLKVTDSDVDKPPDDDRVNTTPLLKDLYQHITPRYAADWKVIGTLLDLPSGELKAIEAGWPANVKWCCNQMLEKWLEMDTTASWGKLFTVIESPAVSCSAPDKADSDKSMPKEREHIGGESTNEQPAYSVEDLKGKSIKANPQSTVVNYHELNEQQKVLLDDVQAMLVVNNQNEFMATMCYLKPPDGHSRILEVHGSNEVGFANKQFIFYIGMFGKCLVAVTRVDQGCGRDAIDHIKCFKSILLIVAVGIAAGFPENKVHYGDVIISKQIKDCSIYRQEDGICTPRGDITPGCKYMIGRLQNSLHWEFVRSKQGTKSSVSIGLFLSKTVLLDSKGGRNEMLRHFGKDAKGFEMEGFSITRLGTECIIIKGVCDYASGKTKEWQPTAALAANDYLYHHLNQLDISSMRVAKDDLYTGNITSRLKKFHHLKRYYLFNQELSTGWPKLEDPPGYMNVAIVKAPSLSRRKNSVPQRCHEECAISLFNTEADIHGVSIEKLLYDAKGKVILIEGCPGCGKTTLCTQICKQWAKGELLSNELVILVQLRHYESVTDIDTLFDKLPEMKEYVQGNNGAGVMLILDGWDELPKQLRSSSIFHDIVFNKNKTFLHSTILVTSRPSCSGDIAKVVEESYQILGFSPQCAVMYIEKYFDDDLQSAKLLLCLLKNHQALHRYFYTPITLSLICFVYRHNHGKLPMTLANLYECFVLLCIQSSIPYFCYQDMKKFTSFSTVPKPLKPAFSELCKTAFNTLKDSKLVFGEEELQLTKEDTDNIHLEHFDGFGLLQVGHYTNELGIEEISYSFIHSTVQEFLAAIYILDTGNASEIINKYFYEDSGLMNVFSFLFGLIPKEPLRPLVGQLIQIFNRNDLLLSSILRCLFERHDETLCREFGRVFSEKRDICLRLYTLLECHYAYYFLSVCGCNKLNVSVFLDLYGSSADLSLEIMAKYLCNTSTDIASLQCIVGTISHKGIEHFTKVLSTQHNLLSLKLYSFSPCDPDCVTTLCDSICKYSPQITQLTLPPTTLNENYIEKVGYTLKCLSLESLDITCSPSELEGMYLDSSVNFCIELRETKYLQTLVLQEWNLSQADSEVIGNVISQNCSLKEIRLNVATAKCLDPIVDGLSLNTSITTFKVWACKISSSNKLGQCLEKCLTLNHSLSYVDFAWHTRKFVSWLPAQVCSICTGLCANTTVVTLDISGCYIDTEACHAVCGMLSQNTTLQHLFLNPVQLENKEVIAMIDCCSVNHTLEVLSLVQWPPKNLFNQKDNEFSFSTEQETMHVLQKVHKSRSQQKQNGPFLTICWTYEDYDQIKKKGLDRM